MPIGEVVYKYPQTPEVFLEYGLHCVGCHVSAFETIEQGCLGHGMKEEDIAKLIEDINAVVGENDSVEVDKTKIDNDDNSTDENKMDDDENSTKDAANKEAGITITTAAVKKIKELHKENDKGDYGLRISAFQGGCCGLSYDFGFENEEQDGDTKIVKDGLTVYIDKDSMGLMKGVVIDYVPTEDGEGFKIENPSESDDDDHGCGCSH